MCGLLFRNALAVEGREGTLMDLGFFFWKAEGRGRGFLECKWLGLIRCVSSIYFSIYEPRTWQRSTSELRDEEFRGWMCNPCIHIRPLLNPQSLHEFELELKFFLGMGIR